MPVPQLAAIYAGPTRSPSRYEHVPRTMSTVLMLLALFSGCSYPSESDITTRLSKHYELKFSRQDRLLREPNIRSARLDLAPDGTFVQKCTAGDGHADTTRGTWSHTGNLISFSIFHDCVGAWPSPPSSNLGAQLTYSLRPEPMIIVEPDLNVLYVVEPGKEETPVSESN